MSVPNVKFSYLESALGRTKPSADGVAGLIIQAAKGSGDTFELDKTYCFHSLADAKEKVKMAGNTYNQIADFFQATGGKGELWVRFVATTETIISMCSTTEDNAAAMLMRDSGGRICIWGISKAEATAYATPEALTADIAAVKNFREQFALNEFMPTRVVIAGLLGTDLTKYPDLNGAGGEGVMVTLLNRTGRNGAVGYTLGMLAALPVQRNLGRVLNGNIGISDVTFTNGKTPKDMSTAYDMLNDYGYVFPMVRFRRAGYFMNDDHTATSMSEDMQPMSNGRVIDKVERIAYDIFSEKVNNDFALSPQGKIGADELKSLQGGISDAVKAQMVSSNEVSAFECYIDPEQDVIATGKTIIQLRVQPRGYHKIIEVQLGFTKTISE